MNVLDKVGERINQTSGYGERFLDGGFTEGLPMKLEVAGSLLACFGVAFGETRGLVLSGLGPSWGIGWGGPSGEDSTSQSGSPPPKCCLLHK